MIGFIKNLSTAAMGPEFASPKHPYSYQIDGETLKIICETREVAARAIADRKRQSQWAISLGLTKILILTQTENGTEEIYFTITPSAVIAYSSSGGNLSDGSKIRSGTVPQGRD